MSLGLEIQTLPHTPSQIWVYAKTLVTEKIGFVEDTKANSMIIGTVTTLVAVIITLLVSTLIVSKISPKIVGNDNSSNTTIANIKDSGYGALDIGAILPYVVVAGAAIFLVISYFQGGRR
jgi:type IV secretory pathway TrbF-like protein